MEVVKARASHVRPIAANMRAADAAEVLAGTGKSPASALSYSLRHSTHAWTVLFDGVPAAMFGVGDLNIMTRTGAPWCLGTDAVEKHARLFARTSRDFRDQLLRRYSVLRNVVDVRHEKSIAWLKWLGFEFSSVILVNGNGFQIFEMRAKNV
jgi:hypothetical protein